MTNPKIETLNAALFAQIEALSNKELQGAELAESISRAKAINEVSGKLLDSAKLVLEAEKLRNDFGSTQPIALLK